MDSKRITVTVELPVDYKALMNGDNVIVLDAHINRTCYSLTVLPEEVRMTVLNAISEQVRIDDREARDALEDFDIISRTAA